MSVTLGEGHFDLVVRDRIRQQLRVSESLTLGALARMGRGFSGLGQSMKDVGRDMIMFFAVPLSIVSIKLMQAAGSAQEMEGRFKAVFGNLSGEAGRFADTLAEALSRNRFRFREQMSLIMAMAEGMGASTSQAFQMSKALTRLTEDLSAFYDIRPEEAFTKITSGLAGEMEPLKRIGIILSEQAVKTFALANGLAEEGKNLDQNTKLWARYLLLMQLTAKAQGQVEREADSLTNRLTVMRETMRQAWTEMAINLSPGLDYVASRMENMAKRLKDLSQSFGELKPESQRMVIDLGLMVIGISGAVLGLGLLVNSFDKVFLAATKIGAALKSVRALMVALAAVPAVQAFLGAAAYAVGFAGSAALVIAGTARYSSKALLEMDKAAGTGFFMQDDEFNRKFPGRGEWTTKMQLGAVNDVRGSMGLPLLPDTIQGRYAAEYGTTPEMEERLLKELEKQTDKLDEIAVGLEVKYLQVLT